MNENPFYPWRHILAGGAVYGVLIAAIAVLAPRSSWREAVGLPPCEVQWRLVDTVDETADAEQLDGADLAIEWRTPEEAAASPKRDWWHVTFENVDNCPDCKRAEGLFRDPAFIRHAGRTFDAIRVHRIEGEAQPTLPCDIFTSSAGGYYRENGCPKTAVGYVARLVRAQIALRAQEAER